MEYKKVIIYFFSWCLISCGLITVAGVLYFQRNQEIKRISTPQLSPEEEAYLTQFIRSYMDAPACQIYPHLQDFQRTLKAKYNLPELEQRLELIIAIVWQLRDKELKQGVCKTVLDQIKEDFKGYDIDWGEVYKKDPKLFKED